MRLPRPSRLNARGAQGKANFFERRVGEYQKAGVMASLAAREANGVQASPYGDYVFRTDCDF